MIQFEKYHGCGNDFIIVNQPLPIATITLMAHRQFGIGCDQFFVVLPDPQYDCKMDIYNNDGSKAEACGNGTRAVVDYLYRQNPKGQYNILGPAQPLHCTRHPDGTISVNMGKPNFAPELIPVIGGYDEHGRLPLDIAGLPRPYCAQMGNPHAIYLVDDAEKIDVAGLGKISESHPIFPKRTNSEFVSKLGENHYRMRVYERGVGITLACGSGACAVFAVLHQLGLVARQCRITLDGGQLQCEYDNDNNIIMTGPAKHVFTGTFYTTR